MSTPITEWESIFSERTGSISSRSRAQYHRFLSHFFQFCRKKKLTYLEDCLPLIEKWLKKQCQNYSICTLYSMRSAIGCFFQIPVSQLHIKLPTIHASRFTRSRQLSSSDRSFSEKNHSELVLLATASGARRGELPFIRKEDICLDVLPFRIHIAINSKGGPARMAEVPSCLAQELLEYYHVCNDGLLLSSVPIHADICSYRSAYATMLYKQYARPTRKIPKAERLKQRKGKRKTYDKAALHKVQQSLGHKSYRTTLKYYIR